MAELPLSRKEHNLTNNEQNGDNEDFIEVNEELLSVLGKSAARTLQAKEKLHYALSDALDASYNFGYELGLMEAHEKIISKLSNSGTEFGKEAAMYLIANPEKEDTE